MAGEKFWLIFPDKPNKRQYIDEPINFGEIDFNLDQSEGGMGRDITISGSKISFRFTIHRLHFLEQILYFFHKDGFELNILFGFSVVTGQEFQGELDGYTAETNDFDYFECSVILESTLQIFKRRSETKVDLFSDKDINGNYIEPLQPINMLLQAKPSIQTSKWTNTQGLREFSAPLVLRTINIAQNLIKSDIKNSFTFFVTDAFLNTEEAKDTFLMVKADTNLKNVNILLKNVYMSTTFGLLRLSLYVGDEFVLLKEVTPYVTFSGDITYNIPDLQRSGEISLFWIGRGTMNINVEYIEITAESTSYNSITPTFRLIDVMKQIAKSISGLDVYAPRYDVGGEFYDNVITNGKLLGGNTNDPFYISWEELGVKSVNPEHFGDSEIQLDGRVFQGIYADYHKPIECGFFDNTQFSGMVKKPNPLYCINKFTFKYGKYQSLKENTEPNSESTIHGESQLTPYNQKVENSKECEIEWTRDAILLDTQQRLSTKVSADTATQDDDTIFAIDTIATETDQQFTESTMLQHSYNGSYLSLRNNGEVNFLVLGIRVDSDFAIEYPDSNAGVYNVTAVTNTELQLVKTSGGSISSANDGLRLTKYTYTIEQETIPLTNRTNEEFTTVFNLTSPDRYSNLRYSVQRNIRNYWDAYLATVNLYWKDKNIKNTYYKNNGKCETEYNGLRVVEKEDFIPTTEPLVTPFMYESVVFANVDFSDFILLQNNIRSLRGFIRTIDNNKRVLKLFPIKMSYQNKSRQLTITGQEKFEKAYLTIEKQAGVITVNDETKLRKLIYTVDDGNKITLYDLERFRLYNGVFWDKVSINGANSPTLEILKEWLDLLG